MVEAFTREALAINVGQGVRGEQVVATVTRIVSVRGALKTIRVDNGPASSRRRSTGGRVRMTSH